MVAVGADVGIHDLSIEQNEERSFRDLDFSNKSGACA